MDINLHKDAVLRIGEVSEIDGKTINITVDKNKNASDLLFNGVILKNISVGAYIEIRKGFLSLIGKVEGEKLLKEKIIDKFGNDYQFIDKNKRYLTVNLCGYINPNGLFIGGIKELPLIGNEAYLLTENKINIIHNLMKDNSNFKINIAKTDIDEIPIYFPIDGLFNSHIAIFGNTGSGKSNTLASLYGEMINTLQDKPNFKNNYKLFFFDFNGEYIKQDCISTDIHKHVYNISTRSNDGDKIPLKFNDFINIETLSILFEATEKTQRPFLNRTLNLYNHIKNKNGDDLNEYNNYFKNYLQRRISDVLCMSNKDTAFKILDLIEEIINIFINEPEKENLRDDIDFHNMHTTFYLRGEAMQNVKEKYFITYPEKIKTTKLYRTTDSIIDINKKTELEQYYIFMLLQFINDLLRFKSQHEHISPVIYRFKSKQPSIEKIFEINEKADLWKGKNIIILNLDKVNIDMKKTIPLLIAKYIYDEHKKQNNKNEKALSIIIDEAHNILSKTSFRETENWKDYRLETFEEIIKEGRKFGVFVTIASQRPNDISDTIISQAHNYFIHQLINERDLYTIGNAISYIDKITEEAIPTLPVGTCIFSGIITPMPIRIGIYELPDNKKPDSSTIKFEKLFVYKKR